MEPLWVTGGTAAGDVFGARGDRVIGSVGNAMRLIDALDALGEARITDLARVLSLSKPSVDRLLVTMQASGFVEQNRETKRFRLTVRFIAISNRIKPRIRVTEIARPYLERLAEQFHETVNLGVLSGGNVFYADTIPTKQMFRIEVTPGTLLPAYCTALGRAMLAYYSESDLDAYLVGVVPFPYTRFTMTDFVKLREAIASVLTRGYAVDCGEILEEVCCIAAPVLDSDHQPVGAISVTAPRSAFESKRPDIEVAITEAAHMITANLQTIEATGAILL